MGESKRKKQAQAVILPQLEPLLPRIASAIRKLATAASDKLGSDCYLHAELGRQLLADHGISATIVKGYASWRVGPADGDVISHTNKEKGYLPPGAQGLAYHVWLECADHVLDFTTYLLPLKGAELDRADGGHTQVLWHPEYLFLARSQVLGYREVAQAPHEGVAHYEADPRLNTVLGKTFELDPEDLAAARLILANPEVHVMGPNQMR